MSRNLPARAHLAARASSLLIVIGVLVAAPAAAQTGSGPGSDAMAGVAPPRDSLPEGASGDRVGRPPIGLEVAQVAEPDVSPGGAFLRSLIVPGWGHAATGSHFRGAFYVAAQSGTAWMLTKSLTRRREARRFRETELELAVERLRASGVTQPDSLRILADQDPRVEAWDDLIESRDQQVEDWAALGIFLLLLGAADAFVAGHLMDRPEPLSLDVAPSLGGGWEVRFSIRPGSRASRP